jgi:hypothetical protein
VYNCNRCTYRKGNVMARGGRSVGGRSGIGSMGHAAAGMKAAKAPVGKINGNVTVGKNGPIGSVQSFASNHHGAIVAAMGGITAGGGPKASQGQPGPRPTYGPVAIARYQGTGPAHFNGVLDANGGLSGGK